LIQKSNMKYLTENKQTGVTTEDDPNNKSMVVVRKNGKIVGKVSRFNNGLDEDGYPLPME